MLTRFLRVFAVALMCCGSLGAWAEPTSFDFKDPKGVNGVAFVVDSKLEPIVGMVSGVSGTVAYDPADPMGFAGSVSVDLATVSLVNAGMVSVLKGTDWLNISDAFVATFEFQKVTAVTEGEEPILTVESVLRFGDMEIPQTLEIQVTHLPDAAKDRGGAKAGDLLVLRSMFKLSRTELGIKPDMGPDQVGDEIMVMVPIVGYSQ